MDWIWIWLIVVAIGLIVEFASMELVSIWCAFAGIVTMIASLFLPVEWQLVIFFALSITLLIGFRKVALKYFLKNDKTKTNTSQFIGQTRKLLTDINAENEGGTIKFNGVVWTAVSHDEKPIEKDSTVKIVAISGNKLIVEKEK